MTSHLVRRTLAFLVLGVVAAFATRARAGTLDDVRTRGELRWGADAQGGAPYVFQDPADPNRLIGFEVEIADAIARRLGVRARPIQGPWDRLFELLDRGDCDIALNGLEVSDERRRVAELSAPYYVATEKLTVRRGDRRAPRSLDALRGRGAGTLPSSFAERLLRRAGADVRTYDGGQDDAYDDLRIGRTDGVLMDEPVARYYGAIDPALEVLDDSFGEVEYAIAAPKGDAAMRQALDQAIAALARDGTLRAIYDRWGLYDARNAALLGDVPPDAIVVPVAYDAWRAAVGRPMSIGERIRTRYPAMAALLAKGALLTLVLSIVAMALAVAMGIPLAIARTYGPPPLRVLAVGYIEIVRGTPLLVQLVILYFGLPELGVRLDPFVAGWLGLGMNYAAAEAENYRAGLTSVPAGQVEAARVLGLSTLQTLRDVVAPQAARVAIPPATNDFIALLKDSSLVSVVTLTELTKSYLNLASATRDHVGIGLLCAAFYLLLGLPFARLARRAEERLGRHLRRAGAPP